MPAKNGSSQRAFDPYWRSVHSQEVDLIVGDQLAIEIKASIQINAKHLKGLAALGEESLVKRSISVSMDPRVRELDGVAIYPWREFLKQLWAGDLI